MGGCNLVQAKAMMERAEKKANQIGVPMVIAVVDEGGNLIALQRMDGALLVSVDIAQNKAWTAVALKMATSELAQLAGTEKELFGINTTNSGRVVIFGGGIPLYRGDELAGAIGVSGGSVDQDIQVAKAGADVFSGEAVHK